MMLESAKRLIVPSARSNVPPFMVMDVMAAAGRIEATAATRFVVTPELLLDAHRRAPLKGVLIASPANPTGTMMTAAALRDLHDAAEAEGIRFISDEIYHGLDYAFPAETAARLSDHAVVIN